MRNLTDYKKSGNILEETIVTLFKQYEREVINYPYLKTDTEKKKSIEKINEINEVIVSLSKEIAI